MNWIELGKKYPKALIELIKWIEGADYQDYSVDELREVCEYSNDSDWFLSSYYREFYEFFDTHGLHLNITCNEYKNGNNFLWQITWRDKDWYNGTCLHGDNNEYPERYMAEFAAFEEAFKILESKL